MNGQQIPFKPLFYNLSVFLSLNQERKDLRIDRIGRTFPKRYIIDPLSTAIRDPAHPCILPFLVQKRTHFFFQPDPAHPCILPFLVQKRTHFFFQPDPDPPCILPFLVQDKIPFLPSFKDKRRKMQNSLSFSPSKTTAQPPPHSSDVSEPLLSQYSPHTEPNQARSARALIGESKVPAKALTQPRPLPAPFQATISPLNPPEPPLATSFSINYCSHC